MTPSRVWVTKEALSVGIRECKVIRTSPGAPDALIVEYPDWPVGLYVEKKDWYRTKEEAIARAETLRYRALLHHDTEIERLEGLKFA